MCSFKPEQKLHPLKTWGVFISLSIPYGIYVSCRYFRLQIGQMKSMLVTKHKF
jgi:hypothetical protein